VGSGPAARALVLDAGALLAIERHDRAVLSLCKVAASDGVAVVIPAGVVAQVWRHGARQAAIARVVGAIGTTVEPLDEELAKLAGRLCGRSGTSDVIDASVVIAARRHRAVVASSDRGDLERLDPQIEVVSC